MATLCSEEREAFPTDGCPVQATSLTQRKRLQLRGGYECIFVKDPPDHLQTECSICLCVLREPYLVDCCGNSFCRSCIEPIKADDKSCPLCNVQFTTCIPDKRLQRTLNELQVYCSHKETGCEWMGKLCNLCQHLNVEPQSEGDRQSGCLFASIDCMFCGEMFQRQEIEKHETDKCSQRPYICEYCADYRSTYEDVTSNHWQVCPSRPVPCPNECGVFGPRSQLHEDHLEKECPLEVIDCTFMFAGCGERLPRKDMSDHITENVTIHTSLLASNQQQQVERLNSRVRELELQLEQSKIEVTELQKANQLLLTKLEVEHKEQIATIGKEIRKAQDQRLKGHLGTLRQEIKKTQDQTKEEVYEKVYEKIKQMERRIVKDIHSHVGLVPFNFTMSDFEQKKNSDTSWFGPSFYTHPRGYKMCLNIDANGWGDGKSSHVAVFLYMMQGEYDGELKWPFRGHITIQLLNQLSNEGHHTRTTEITDRVDDSVAGQVKEGERAEAGWGFHQFIQHGCLQPKYLRNDCLMFCIRN